MRVKTQRCQNSITFYHTFTKKKSNSKFNYHHTTTHKVTQPCLHYTPREPPLQILHCHTHADNRYYHLPCTITAPNASCCHHVLPSKAFYMILTSSYVILLSHPTFTKTSHAHPFAISCSHPKFPATMFQPSPPNLTTCTKHSKLHFHHTSKQHLTCLNQSTPLTTSISHPPCFHGTPKKSHHISHHPLHLHHTP